MKRDMELVRKILLAVEKQNGGKKGMRTKIDGYDDEVVQTHVGLLHQRGLVDAIDASSLDGEAYIITGLTWEGHDFIEAARNETVWRKAMKMVTDKGGVVTLEVLKVVLKQLVSDQILGPGQSI